jgi:hypothetical protein
MAETGQYFNTHPVTGEPGRWRLFQDQGYVNFDQNAPQDVYWNPEVQRYMGMPGVRYNYDPNTGKEGDFVFLGTMGWVDLTPAAEQPDPGGVPFGGSNSPLSGSTQSAASPQQPAGDNGATTDTTVTTQTTTDPTSMSSMGGATGGYSPSTPLTLGYQMPSLSSISSTGGIDYVKLINSALAADVMSGMLTGRGRIV